MCGGLHLVVEYAAQFASQRMAQSRSGAVLRILEQPLECRQRVPLQRRTIQSCRCLEHG
jgi:hypothetical protein